MFLAMKMDSLGAQAGFWATSGWKSLPGHRFESSGGLRGDLGRSNDIVLVMKMDRLEGLASFWATWGWKWLPGHRFGNENGEFESSGGLLGDLALERSPMASLWQ